MRLDIPLDVFHQIGAPRRLHGIRIFGNIHVIQAGRNPLIAPRMALDRIVHAVDDSGDCFIVAAKCQFVDKCLDIRVFLDVLIDRFQRIHHGVCPQDFAFMLFCHTEVRSQSGNGGVGAQHL